MKIEKRFSNKITDPKDIEYLVGIKEEECTKLSFAMDMFGDFDDKRRFNTYDTVTIPSGSYGPEGNKNINPINTTVGIWVFNKAFIEKELFDLFGYINKPITSKVFKEINKKMSYAVMEDKLPLDAIKRYIMKTEKFQPYCNILSTSITENMLSIPKVIAKKKQELLKKYEKELSTNDPSISQKIEDELIEECKVLLKDDPSIDMINSGSKIDWGNNFKNMFVMRGASKSPDPLNPNGEYTIIKSDFMTGIAPDEYAAFADSLTIGPYSRAKKTADGGAMEKTFVKALEHLYILPAGSDCGTKRTKSITLTKDNIDDWMYSYIVESGNRLVELTSDNRDSYLGKKVKFRYSGLCESEKGICNKCAGNLFTRLGIKNVGVASYIIPATIKLKAMKNFHDCTIKIFDMGDYGYNKIFGYE